MATGWPMKTTYADGDVYSAQDVNDITGTINLLGQSVTTSAGKNAALNGSMAIWQRGTSISVSASSAPYTADRWQVNVAANQASTVSRQATGDTTNLPNIQYALRFQRNSGQTGTSEIVFGQSLESVNSIPFAGRAVTLSWYARAGANFSPTSGEIRPYVLSGTGTDQNRVTAGYTGDNAVASGAKNLTTTWQRFTITGTVPATATELAILFAFSPTGTAGANDYLEITGVQLELGSTATTFSRAGGTIQGELAACQRYYQAWSYYGTGTRFNNIMYTPMTFVVPMRVAPTMAKVADGDALGIATISSPSFADITAERAQMSFSTSGTSFLGTRTGLPFSASAEL
jgi:hypothetical protein